MCIDVYVCRGHCVLAFDKLLRVRIKKWPIDAEQFFSISAHFAHCLILCLKCFYFLNKNTGINLKKLKFITVSKSQNFEIKDPFNGFLEISAPDSGHKLDLFRPFAPPPPPPA